MTRTVLTERKFPTKISEIFYKSVQLHRHAGSKDVQCFFLPTEYRCMFAYDEIASRRQLKRWIMLFGG